MILVRQTPVSSGTPAYNPIEFVVDSTNKTQDQFQYIADVYITGETSYKRFKLSPNPTLGSSVFDLSGYIQDFVDNLQFANEGVSNVAGSYSCPNMARQFTVKWGEEYGLSTSGTVVYPNMTSSSGLVWNSVFDDPEFDVYSTNNTFNNFNPNNNLGSQFLTNAPVHQQDGAVLTYARTINNGQHDYLYFNNYVNTARYAYIETYDSTPAIIQQALVSLQPSYGDFKDSFIKIDSGYNINYIKQANITGATQPLLTSSVAFYAIAMLDSLFTNVSDYVIYRYNDSPCSDYTNYCLYFLNKLGGYDSFNFKGASTKNTKIDKSFFKRSQGTQTQTSFTRSPSEHSKATYNTKSSHEIKITSDWINDAESTWLLELVTSPVVYMTTDNDITTLRAVNVVDKSYTEKSIVKDQLFNIELTIELSYDTYRQKW